MNTIIITNYSKLKSSLFLFPLFLLLTIVLFLYYHDALNVYNYIHIQKNCFFFLNSLLSQFPSLEYNLTQFGDALISLSFLSLFIIYAPKIWESLVSAFLISPLFSCLLKKVFAVPRPAVVLEHKSFTIIGKTLSGCNSLPSGHSITIGAVLTVLFFAFIPKKIENKVLWSLFMFFAGLFLVLTRVGVGAHYPLDALIGGILGYISGIAGIFISRKYKIFRWINEVKYYPIIILIFLVGCVCIINRILSENLIIYYLALIILVVSLYKIIFLYVKK